MCRDDPVKRFVRVWTRLIYVKKIRRWTQTTCSRWTLKAAESLRSILLESHRSTFIESRNEQGFGTLPATWNIQYHFDFWARHGPPEPHLRCFILKILLFSGSWCTQLNRGGPWGHCHWTRGSYSETDLRFTLPPRLWSINHSEGELSWPDLHTSKKCNFVLKKFNRLCKRTHGLEQTTVIADYNTWLLIQCLPEAKGNIMLGKMSANKLVILSPFSNLWP